MFLWFILFHIAIFHKTVRSHNFCQNLKNCQIQVIAIIESHESRQPSKSSQFWPLIQTCRDLRDHLDCMLALSPFCEERDALTNHPIRYLVSTSKSFLDHKCDREAGVEESFCYKRPTVLTCEDSNPFPSRLNNHNCWKFLRFRECIHQAIRVECSPQEQNLVNQYLIEKSGNMTWLCYNSSNIPQLNVEFTFEENDHKVLDSATHFNSDSNASLDRRISDQNFVTPLVRYGDSEAESLAGQRQYSLHSPPKRYDFYPNPENYPHGSDWHQPPATGGVAYQDRYYPGHQMEGVRPPYIYPGNHPQTPLYPPGAAIPDRPGYTNPFSSEICLERARYLGRHCEDALLQSQRIANHLRTPWEVQRAICCGLLYFRDCLYRSLQQTCTNPDPYLLSLALPLSVNQQLATCRTFSRVQCRAATQERISVLTLALGFLILYVNNRNFKP